MSFLKNKLPRTFMRFTPTLILFLSVFSGKAHAGFLDKLKGLVGNNSSACDRALTEEEAKHLVIQATPDLNLPNLFYLEDLSTTSQKPIPLNIMFQGHPELLYAVSKHPVMGKFWKLATYFNSSKKMRWAAERLPGTPEGTFASAQGENLLGLTNMFFIRTKDGKVNVELRVIHQKNNQSEFFESAIKSAATQVREKMPSYQLNLADATAIVDKVERPGLILYLSADQPANLHGEMMIYLMRILMGSPLYD